MTFPKPESYVLTDLGRRALGMPKPLKTSPKARKRIPRGKRPNRQRKTSRAALVREADKLWASIIKRAGVCDFSEEGLFPDLYPHECWGSLQAMHGISRRYPGTRWNLLNGFEGCQKAHWRYTVRVQEWDRFLLHAWGHETYQELWRLALSTVDVDMVSVLAKLREEKPVDNGAMTGVD